MQAANIILIDESKDAVEKLKEQMAICSKISLVGEFDNAQEAVDFCKLQKVDVAIIVGSGLIDSAPELNNQIKVSYDELGLPKSKVKGHSGYIFN